MRTVVSAAWMSFGWLALACVACGGDDQGQRMDAVGKTDAQVSVGGDMDAEPGPSVCDCNEPANCAATTCAQLRDAGPAADASAARDAGRETAHDAAVDARGVSSISEAGLDAAADASGGTEADAGGTEADASSGSDAGADSGADASSLPNGDACARADGCTNLDTPYVMCADGDRSPSHDCPAGVETFAAARQIWAQPFEPQVSGKVTRLGIRTASLVGGETVWLSLHADQAGLPASMLNRTPTSIPLIAHSLNYGTLLSLTSASTSLSKGTRYWIVAWFALGSPSLLRQPISVPAGAYRKGTVPDALPSSPRELTPDMTQASEGGQVSLFVEFQP